MEPPMSREEAALRIEARLAQLNALGLDCRIRNPLDRKPLTGEAKIRARIAGHQGIVADINRSESEVQTALAAIQRLQSQLT